MTNVIRTFDICAEYQSYLWRKRNRESASTIKKKKKKKSTRKQQVNVPSKPNKQIKLVQTKEVKKRIKDNSGKETHHVRNN